MGLKPRASGGVVVHREPRPRPSLAQENHRKTIESHRKSAKIKKNQVLQVFLFFSRFFLGFSNFFRGQGQGAVAVRGVPRPPRIPWRQFGHMDEWKKPLRIVLTVFSKCWPLDVGNVDFTLGV